ncbi:conserved protein of unknown function [Methylacidimicrobium sp. AP8]|uniref:hypothetical protein n=1 Tax=Methylacidimicrobium sp. AP8 TaxID=2730359 RepID=UPI0018C04055|nr:hypothetical protein [Methylacidimicrobium sp. AP8]CAB4242663.1 conserved protein of unknown function [Methylacidimicrobium sp. AP8]
MGIEKQILVVVEADPSRSGRAAEGLRVAAGLSMHPEIRVTVVLARVAAQAWKKGAARCVDREVWDRALADLAENRVPLLEEEPCGGAWHGVIRFAD